MKIIMSQDLIPSPPTVPNKVAYADKTSIALLVSSALHRGDTFKDRVSRSAVTVAMAAIPPVLMSPW